MLELYQLVQLLAIAECGTISKAAEQLHLSQPALSRSMQKLEEELQVTLFDRQKNKITLNKNGRLAVEQARRVVEQARQDPEALHAAPHNAPIGRPDEVTAARTPILRWTGA